MKKNLVQWNIYIDTNIYFDIYILVDIGIYIDINKSILIYIYTVLIYVNTHIHIYPISSLLK